MISNQQQAMSGGLLGILRSIKQQRLTLDAIERVLRNYYPQIALQREGEKLLADIVYVDTPMSLTFSYYSETHGEKRLSRVDIDLQSHDHYYLAPDGP